MALLVTSRVFEAPELKTQLEILYGPIKNGTGQHWKIGREHSNHPSESALINDTFIRLGGQIGEIIVIFLQFSAPPEKAALASKNDKFQPTQNLIIVPEISKGNESLIKSKAKKSNLKKENS